MRRVRVFIIIALTTIALPFAAAADKWGDFAKRDCVSWGKRKYSAILWDIPVGASWENACAKKGATVKGQKFAKPSRCAKAGGHMWGEFYVDDTSCTPHWGAWRKEHCVAISEAEGTYKRQYSAILWDIPAGYSWEEACHRMPVKIGSYSDDRPYLCTKSNASAAIGVGNVIISGAVGAAVGTVSGPGGIAAGAATGLAIEAINQATGGGAINMWGVAYVPDATCPD